MAREKQDEVAARGSTAVAGYDYGERADEGFENQTGEDLVLPFISVLQALSPQVTGDGGPALKDARPGLLFNTVTEELYDGKQGLEFIPCYTEHVYVEWRPREKGGGMVARHEIDAEIVEKAKGIWPFGDLHTGTDPTVGEKGDRGNDLIETFYVYGVVVRPDGAMPAVIAFTSSKIKVYKKWNTRLSSFTLLGPDERKRRPPLYAHRVRVTTVQETNKRNQTYHNFALTSAEEGGLRDSLLDPSSEVFQAAHQVYEMIKSGAARASFETQAATGRESAGSEDETPDF